MNLAGLRQRESEGSRAAHDRLDKPRQVIPQHGCVPAVPASVSPGKAILV